MYRSRLELPQSSLEGTKNAVGTMATMICIQASQPVNETHDDLPR